MSEQLGQYELVRHLATGGMAEIFIARQSGPAGFDRELAIKRILPHLAREDRFITMFLDEARIAARLRHPNIVQIYELGEEAGEYFIAMEYIEGGDLADLLDHAEQREVQIPIAMSVRIIADVLAALDYAHDYAEDGRPLRIVHRDVSPHNVLIGRDGMIKLVDFGIAHAVERHAKTETGLVKGKLSYMAPEQIEQEGVDRRADIFSAGALLYELLTGRPPFGRELAAVNAILNDDPTDPRVLRPDIPDELAAVIARALRKKPEDRYQSAQEMLEELEGVLRVFNKYVSPKHVARFAQALTSGAPIDGYDDVSQAIPRAVSNEAMLRAAQAVATPVPSAPAALVADDDTPTDPDVGQAIAEAPLPVRDNEYDLEDEHHPLPIKWFVAAAAGMLAVGGAIAVFGNTGVSSARGAQQAVSGEADMAVIELDEQIVDRATDGDGFTFDADEVELAQLEGWVAALEPAQVDRMLAAHFEREDGDYLWSVRGPRLVQEFMGPTPMVNPGDPRAAKMLGLEDLDEAVLKPPRSTPKTLTHKRRKTRRTPAVPKERPAEDPPAEVAPQVAEAPQVPAAKKATPAPKKKKNDLRIIDRAVPY